MTTHGPEPRKHLERPEYFGKRDDATWREPPDNLTSQGEVAAAYYQHIAAYQVQRAISDHHDTVTRFAQRLGIRPDTLHRKLRGEDRASLQDVLTWALAYGIDMLPAPNNAQGLLP